jgi:hypothetical protein
MKRRMDQSNNLQSSSATPSQISILVIGFNQQNTRYRLMCLLWDIGHDILGAWRTKGGVSYAPQGRIESEKVSESFPDRGKLRRIPVSAEMAGRVYLPEVWLP